MIDACPSEDTIVAFLEGRLDDDSLRIFYAHVAGCDACTALVSEMEPPKVPAAQGESDALADTSLDLKRSVSATPELMIGCRMGRYHIGSVLGMGAMGVVYLARDTKLNRKVALKVLRPKVSDASVARLLREAQAMAQLPHPNVVGVHDVGTWEGRAFVAMDYVDGGTLAQWLTQGHRTWREVVNVFMLAGQGLSAAHSAGIVHRDFKPENVLVGRDGTVRVTDFGLARSLSSYALSTDSVVDDFRLESTAPDALQIRLTREGTVVGTPAYMAPEQRSSILPVDCRADIFSFCVALYESVYHELPFPGATPKELLESMRSRSIRPAPSRTPVPSSLRRAILRGLHPDPRERYESMEDVVEAIDPRKHEIRSAFVRAFALSLALLVPLGFGAWHAWRSVSAQESAVTSTGTTASSAVVGAEPNPTSNPEETSPPASAIAPTVTSRYTGPRLSIRPRPVKSATPEKSASPQATTPSGPPSPTASSGIPIPDF